MTSAGLFPRCPRPEPGRRSPRAPASRRCNRCRCLYPLCGHQQVPLPTAVPPILPSRDAESVRPAPRESRGPGNGLSAGCIVSVRSGTAVREPLPSSCYVLRPNPTVRPAHSLWSVGPVSRSRGCVPMLPPRMRDSRFSVYCAALWGIFAWAFFVSGRKNNVFLSNMPSIIPKMHFLPLQTVA